MENDGRGHLMTATTGRGWPEDDGEEIVWNDGLEWDDEIEWADGLDNDLTLEEEPGQQWRAGLGASVDFCFDGESGALRLILTRGLWQLGVPELYLAPPANCASTSDPATAPRLAVFLGGGLARLGYRLLAAPGLELPPYRTYAAGRPVSFWLAGQEPPGPLLASHLGPEVDTVTRVECSLLHEPLLGGGD